MKRLRKLAMILVIFGAGEAKDVRIHSVLDKTFREIAQCSEMLISNNGQGR
jgi:hypothetical protein